MTQPQHLDRPPQGGQDQRGLRRRQVVVGAAWTVPAVAWVAPAPAFAASGNPPPPVPPSAGAGSCKYPGQSGGGTCQGNANYDFAFRTQVCFTNNSGSTVTVSNVTATFTKFAFYIYRSPTVTSVTLAPGQNSCDLGISFDFIVYSVNSGNREAVITYTVTTNGNPVQYTVEIPAFYPRDCPGNCP